MEIVFKEKSITGICGNSSKNTIGREIAYLDNLKGKVSYVSNNIGNYVYKKTVLEEIKYHQSHYHNTNDNLLEILESINLDESYLNKNPNKLSTSEQKKVMLASIISCNPEVIVLDDFGKGLNKNSKLEIKKILKSLDKTIIIITNDLEFLNNYVDRVYLVIDKRIILDTSGKNLLFEDELYEYVDMPEIIDFIQHTHREGHSLKKYDDIKELMKEIYREIK